MQGKGKESLAQRSLPLNPHQKHGGRHRPPYPLWAQRGETAVSPLWKPLFGERGGPRPPPLETTPRGGTGDAESDCGGSPLSPLETPPGMSGSGSGKRSRGCPLCSLMNAMPADAGTHLGHLGTFGAAGRRLLDFAGSAYRPLLRMGELTQMCQLIPKRLFF